MATPWSNAPSVSTNVRSVTGAGDDMTFEQDRLSLGGAGMPLSDRFSPLRDVSGPLFNDVGEPVFAGQEEHDRESMKFLIYAKEIMNDADSHEVYFFDLVSSATCGRRAAVQAFSHVLVLATRGYVKVEQEQSYGDICLKLA